MQIIFLLKKKRFSLLFQRLWECICICSRIAPGCSINIEGKGQILVSRATPTYRSVECHLRKVFNQGIQPQIVFKLSLSIRPYWTKRIDFIWQGVLCRFHFILNIIYDGHRFCQTPISFFIFSENNSTLDFLMVYLCWFFPRKKIGRERKWWLWDGAGCLVWEKWWNFYSTGLRFQSITFEFVFNLFIFFCKLPIVWPSIYYPRWRIEFHRRW